MDFRFLESSNLWTFQKLEPKFFSLLSVQHYNFTSHFLNVPIFQTSFHFPWRSKNWNSTVDTFLRSSPEIEPNTRLVSNFVHLFSTVMVLEKWNKKWGSPCSQEIWWANLTPFISNHARYVISSRYILQYLKVKVVIDRKSRALGALIYNLWKYYAILNDTDSKLHLFSLHTSFFFNFLT